MDTKKVCIIGAGISGVSVANNLTRSDVEVCLVDRNPYPGGRTVHYGCKATDTCEHCGVCLVRDALARLEDNSRIKLLLSAIPYSLNSSSDGSFEMITQTSNNQQSKILADVVVIATGFTPFNPAINRKWGYGGNPRVITGSDLERLLYEEDYFPEEFEEPPENIAFIQCVGSRNIMEGMAQCSRICCAYALRMANRVKHELPDTDIDVYYMDIQRFGKNFNGFWGRVAEKINFIRSNPISITVTDQKKPVVRFEAIPGNKDKESVYDLVVLSHGLCPSEHQDELTQLFDLDNDSSGFFRVPTYAEQQKGVFLAGTCKGPMNIAECVEDAATVSEQVLRFLGGF